MDEAEWPPPADRVRSAVWFAEEHIERREYASAAQVLEQAFRLGGDEELLHGLHHLAAAGWRHQEGDDARARRQLAHARRRLGRRRARLVALVTQDIGS